MSSYPKPRYNTSIFVYGNKPSNVSSKVIVPGPSPPDTSISEDIMTSIALFTNYSYIWAAYPWMPAPNVKPKSIYTLWNQLLYGSDYLSGDPSNYQWTESLEYVIDGIISPYKIQGPSIDFKATATRPRGLTANPQITLTRPYKPFVLSFSGTLTDSCITFECDNFKMELMADYSVIYYVDDIEVARSIPLGIPRAINLLGFSEGILTGNNVMQDTTGTYSFTRLRIASEIDITNTGSTTLPAINKSGSATWTFKNGITLNGLNLYDLPITSTNLVYETYLMWDICNVRTEPPTYIPVG